MQEKRNLAMISGEIVKGIEYSHEIFGERFYTTEIHVTRSSGTVDRIPVMISDRMTNITHMNIGDILCVEGQFRSFNRHDGEKNRLELFLFAMELKFLGKIDDKIKNNQIFLDGYICKEPVYRKTPLGREITDVLLAVNRSYNKSDYIPCIFWGRNARCVAGMNVGTRLKITGRIQSREYSKRISENEYETKTAYEASISKLEVIDGEERKDQVADAE